MSAPNHYLPGQAVRVSVAVTSLGAGIDPSSVQVQTKDPGGSVNVYGSPTHDGTGFYHQDFVLPSDATPGVWTCKWTTTGAPVAQNGVAFSSFIVDPLWF